MRDADGGFDSGCGLGSAFAVTVGAFLVGASGFFAVVVGVEEAGFFVVTLSAGLGVGAGCVLGSAFAVATGGFVDGCVAFGAGAGFVVAGFSVCARRASRALASNSGVRVAAVVGGAVAGLGAGVAAGCLATG